MSNVRLLNTSDYGQVESLLHQSGGLMRHSGSHPEYTPDYLKYVREKYLDPKDTNNLLYGYLVNGLLVMQIGVAIWQGAPCYSWTNLKTREKYRLNLLDPQNPLAVTMQRVMEDCEARELYQFFHMRSTTKWPRGRFIGSFYNGLTAMKRYHRVIHEFIPAGQKGKWPATRALQGNKIWDYDVVVETGILAQKYRPAHYQLDDLGQTEVHA